jgi:FkbM family methyltransferase
MSAYRKARRILSPVKRRVLRIPPPDPRGLIDDRNMGLLLAFCLRHDSNCVDVGTHTGDIIRKAVQFAPDGRHIAFEPLPEYATRLREWFPMVDVREIALGNEQGTTEFVRAVKAAAYSGLRERPYPVETPLERFTVEVDTLDAALPHGYVPHFIKVDVEGGELDVLRGGANVITKHRPLIVFEQGPTANAGYGVTHADLFNFVTGDLRYRVFNLDGDGPYSVEQFVDHVGRRYRFNYIARDW